MIKLTEYQFSLGLLCNLMLFGIFITNTDLKNKFGFEICQWHKPEGHNQNVPLEDIKILRS